MHAMFSTMAVMCVTGKHGPHCITEDDVMVISDARARARTHARSLSLSLSLSLSEYVIVIAFPPQQWLHGRDSMLRYTYTTSLV